MEKFLQIIGGFCLIVVTFFARLAILCRIWNLVTASLNLPHLTMGQMFGVSLFISAVTYEYTERKKASGSEFVVGTLSTIASLLFAWLIAYWCFG